MTQLDVAKTPGQTASPETPTASAWLRLPCCDAAVHPVLIERHQSSRLEISAPEAPHTKAITVPDSDVLVQLSWSFGDGSFMLSCHVDPESTPDRWILNVDGEGDFVRRRRHVRVPATAPVQLIDHRRDVSVRADLVDISEGGIKCVFDEWLFGDADNNTYRLAIQLNGSVLIVEATPMWSGRAEGNKVYVGFAFAPLHFSILARIRSHVDETLASTSGRLV